jgi:peptidoglycan/LPS O-acetylase OafA/YrhL
MMRHIEIEKIGRWDLALACASLSLVMLVLTGLLYSQHHKPRAAPVLVSNVLAFSMTIAAGQMHHEPQRPNSRSRLAWRRITARPKRQHAAD